MIWPGIHTEDDARASRVCQRIPSSGEVARRCCRVVLEPSALRDPKLDPMRLRSWFLSLVPVQTCETLEVIVAGSVGRAIPDGSRKVTILADDCQCTLFVALGQNISIVVKMRVVLAISSDSTVNSGLVVMMAMANG